MTIPTDLQIHYLTNADYETTHDAMLTKTLQRIEQKKQGITTPDELWTVEHQDVYTLGQAGKPEHILQKNDTPIIKTDRGGQVTWHGKGQLVVYFLFDINELGWGVRDLVTHAENIIIATVRPYLPSNFSVKARQDAPGVYVYNADDMELGKIASLGFKIKHGFSYHGIALNLVNDLTPFNLINPCGYAGMTMLRLADFAKIDMAQVTHKFIEQVRLTRQTKTQVSTKDKAKIYP
ncbi:lipoyl(octanoyl) transferase LipB [Moraxella boevrei]|uniref:lipoyl(octanoyl) transferase LipB n=1 Tax=Faucicola boevrei TaxID=346665 RepID=UPI0037367C1D